jgi:PGF-pre-PGF domain-containing protein
LKNFLLFYGGIRINRIRILILATLILTLCSCVGAAAEVVVHSGQSIQSAVTSAADGDTIIVEPGTYTENIVISGRENLLIRSSEGPASTVVEANTSSEANVTVFTISACENITIQGLNITGAGPDHSGVYVQGSTYCKVKDNILHDDALGVFLDSSHYAVVSNNTATKSNLAGVGRAISIEQSNYTTVSENSAFNNKYGIYIRSSRANILSRNTVNLSTSSGIVMEYATNVTLENNSLNSNGAHGIYLTYSDGNFMRNNNVFNSTNNSFEIYTSSGNEISGNIVSDDSINTLTHGIHLNTGYNNVLRNNAVSNNDYGIAMIYSNNNSVVNNTAFTNNRGIYLAYTSSINTISGNDVYSNVNGGIVLQNCSGNNIVSNTARLNNGDASYGIILGGASDNNVSYNNASGNRRGIYITSSASGNTVSGNTLNSNSGHGILLENAGSNNNLSRNTLSSNGGDGIYLLNSNNTYVLNNVAPRNSLRGIEVSTSYENVISNNTVSNNVASGIRLSLSNNNTISGNTAYNDTYGIEFNSSRNNTVSSNNITKSRTHGLFLCAQSKYNLIYNNYLNNTYNTDNNNNESTWNIANTSGTNIAGGYYLGGNFWGDPVLKDDHSQTQPDANGDGFTDTVYNGDNLVDNLPLVTVYRVLPSANFNTNVTSGLVPLTVQFTDLSQNATSISWDFGDGASSADQNTTHTYSAAGNYTVTLTASNVNGTATKTVVITATGPSIIYPVADFSTSATNGYVPLSVTFTDLSQNATSISWDVNGDGTEDSNASSFNYEYASAGTYTAKLTATNANGTNEKTATITVEEEDDDDGGSSHSSGGVGGGGGSPEPAKNVEVKEISQTFIANGKPIKFDFTKNATCVVYVGFDSKKTAGKTTTIAEQLKNKSTLVSNLTEGKVYKYFNVWVGNSGFATSTNIENPVICFKVLKSWVQDNNIDKDSITLNRYSNKTWEQLPASQLKEDSKYLYFTADVSGYSFFAITGESKASSPDESVTEIEPDDDSGNSQGNMGDTGSEAGNESGEEENNGAPGFGMVCGIVGLSAAFLYRRK